MRIGVPKESKDHEFRVGVIPTGVKALAADGHEVWVESGAGRGTGFGDDDYVAAGAKVVDVSAVWRDDAPSLLRRTGHRGG